EARTRVQVSSAPHRGAQEELAREHDGRALRPDVLPSPLARGALPDLRGPLREAEVQCRPERMICNQSVADFEIPLNSEVRRTGSGLGDQGGLALSRGGRWLFAVNAGSNELTVFRVSDESTALTIIDKVSTVGKTPISVTIHKQLVYVLNAGDAVTPANIAGFRLSEDG